MAKKIISYKLNKDGTVPDFVEDGGYLVKDANDRPNRVLLGVSKNGADLSGIEAEFVDEASTITYVETYLSNSTIIQPNPGEERVFVVADAVATLFAKLA